MRLRLALAVVLAAAAGLARADAALNVISSVDVKDEGGTVVLTVKGSKPPNFTTFSMADPPRFVIDLSESRFQGVKEDLLVRDGVVNVVKNLSYGSDATAIARIMIAFQVEVDPPEVQAVGETLVVRVTKPGGAAVAAAAAPPAAAAAAQAEAEAKARAQAQAQAQAEAKAQAEAQANAQAEAERLAREEQARVEAQQARAVADAEARAAELADARKAAAGAQAAPAAPAVAPLAADDAVARAEAEKAAREEEMRRAREAYEAERQAAVKAAAPPAPAEPTPAPAEPEAAPAPVEPGPALAALAPGPAAEPEPSGDALAASSLAPAPRAQLREVGFRQLPGVSRVYVRTSVTPRFSVEDAGENVVRVELENTRAARRNDTRFLDTSFFPSAVAMVTPMRRGSSYVVEIRLRERVPYQQRIEGDMLALDFARPASAGAAPADGAGDPLPAGAAPEAAPGGDAPPAPVPTPGR